MITCVGGAHIDRTARCHEAFCPGSSNPVSVSTHCGGVALNIATNLVRLGRPVGLISAVGRDADGAALLKMIEGRGIGTEGVIRDERHNTACYTAVLDRAGELLFGIADMDIYAAIDCSEVVEQCANVGPPDAYVIDANLSESCLVKLTASLPPTARIFAAATSPAKAPRLAPLLGRLEGLFGNRAEAEVLAEREVVTPEQTAAAANALRERGVANAFVTLGAEGVAVSREAEQGGFLPPPTKIRDVNGAGDAFAAATVDSLLAGRPLRDAVGRGLAAASLTAESDGAVDDALSAERISARAALQ